MGSTAFTLLLILVVLLMLRKRHHLKEMNRSNGRRDSGDQARNAIHSNDHLSLQEIGRSGRIDQAKELGGKSKAELLDTTIPTELSVMAPHDMHKLTTSRTPPRPETALKVESPDARDKFAIVVATTKVTRDSREKTPSSTMGVETIICSTQQPRPLDLNRSIPLTPIHNSGQTSPILFKIPRGLPVLRNNKPMGAHLSQVRSMSKIVVNRHSFIS